MISSQVYSGVCINASVILMSNYLILVQQCEYILKEFFKCTYVHLHSTGLGSFWVFHAQICILPNSRDSLSLIFDIYFNTKRI